MSEKTWLITGCSTGFGRALAELLLGQGERVVATARKPETLAALVAPHGERGLALRLDVTRPEEIESVVKAATDKFGKIDVLVNNAGYGHVGLTEDVPVDFARVMMETHLFGPIGLVKAVLPEMRKRRSGQIVNIGSVAGQVGVPATSAYCASKFALAGFTESLAAEVKLFGIKVTLVELGPFATNLQRSMAFTPPSTLDYNLGDLAQAARISERASGDDPVRGAAALVAALRDPAPPLRLILGQHGLDVVTRRDAKRQAERERWLSISRLEVPA